jgi:hypothetical protein
MRRSPLRCLRRPSSGTTRTCCQRPPRCTCGERTHQAERADLGRERGRRADLAAGRAEVDDLHLIRVLRARAVSVLHFSAAGGRGARILGPWRGRRRGGRREKEITSVQVTRVTAAPCFPFRRCFRLHFCLWFPLAPSASSCTNIHPLSRGNSVFPSAFLIRLGSKSSLGRRCLLTRAVRGMRDPVAP